MHLPIQWTWRDGWILMAILTASGEKGTNCSLAEILATADGINHAIPTSDELSRSLTKLTGVGVVEVDADRYRLAAAHRSAVEIAYQGRGGLFESANKGERWLKAAALPVVDDREIFISEATASAAYDEYIATTRKRHG